MYKKYIKRILDFVFAVILLPPVILVILICGIFIKLEDGGPIFYCGKRLGRDGKIFRMYKLRSMKVNAPDLRNADGSTYNSDDDPRVTKVGRILRKTSLDELPQLFNVLKGDMSFIGPRPDLPDALNSYNDKERLKLIVRPGISGYSQAYYRNSITAAEKFKNDIFYVNNISLVLDIKILLVTVVNVFKRKNINLVSKDRNDNLVITNNHNDKYQNE